MTNTDTNELDASVEQCVRMIESGAQLLRLTTQGSREVLSLAKIRDLLKQRGFDVPLAADVHFRPTVALEAARVVEKIRINPGNYMKGSGVETLLPQLLKLCKENRTAIRIGVNHGSLDESILRDFGDTPAGMVESAMRFLRICKQAGDGPGGGFHEIEQSPGHDSFGSPACKNHAGRGNGLPLTPGCYRGRRWTGGYY